MLIIKVVRRNLIPSVITKTQNFSNYTSSLVRTINNGEILNIYSQPTLIKNICYNFVNIAISSKYYHAVLPTQIQQCMRLIKQQKILNQKIFLLQHLIQIVISNPKFIRYDFNKFIIKQLNLWKNGQGRFQRIASVAWIINKINLKSQLKLLYQEIIKRIENDQWYVDFDQSVKALQAYSTYEDKQKIMEIYQKIQRNLGIALTDANMIYYKRICQALVQAQRYRSPIWDKIQQFVIKNLSMPYTPQTFFDIFKAFAISHNGSQVFYEVCHEIMYKGHLYNFLGQLKNNLKTVDSTGDYLALIVQTYGIVNKNTPFPLSPQFLNFIYKSMLASKLQYYNISSLTKIVKYMPLLSYHQQQIQNVIYNIINHKQFTQYHSLNQIQQLYSTIEQKLGYVPDKLIQKVQRLVEKDLQRHILPIPQAIKLVQFLLPYRAQRQKNNIGLIESLNKTIQKKYKYLYPDQLHVILSMINSNKSFDLLVDKLSHTNLLIKYQQH